MANVLHTCFVVYGSYSGHVEILCNDEDDLETIKARIRKQEKLDFLSMATYTVRILSTKKLEEENY